MQNAYFFSNHTLKTEVPPTIQIMSVLLANSDDLSRFSASSKLLARKWAPLGASLEETDVTA